MAKHLPLDESWWTPFNDLLGASPTFGPLAIDSEMLGKGTLQAWVPEGMNSLPSRNLLSDIDYQESFGVWESLVQSFSCHLEQGARRLIIADTRNSQPLFPAKWETLELSWFICQSLRASTASNACLYLTERQNAEEKFDHLMSFAGGYPTVITLTSLPPDTTITPGDYLALDAPVLASLVARIERIFVGIFDERSYMVWSR